MSETPSTPGTPGSLALENYKRQEKSVAVFKKPANRGVTKLKQKILTEEKYIEEIAKIIQRDFFPDLDKLRAQNDYLDAMDRKDYAEMAAIRAKYSGGRKPTDSGTQSPATFETPASMGTATPRHHDPATDTPKSTVSTASSSRSSRKGIAERHTLDSFLQSYTSEDNFSFQEIIDTADEKLRQKFNVLYTEERLTADKLARALTLPSIEKQFEQPDPLREIETWTYKNKNSIMYVPDGVELTQDEKIEAVNRKQVVQHSATRLAANPFEAKKVEKDPAEVSKAQLLALGNKIGLDGNPLGANVKPAPQIGGFDLLKTPSPRPGEAFSPLMTWGEIEGTPFRLDGSDTPVVTHSGPSFKINENSRRENIALALAEKVGDKMRAQKKRAEDRARRNSESPFLRSNMERLASMSPAARRLASSKLGLRTPTLTPTPIRTPAQAGKGKTTTPFAVARSKTPSSSAPSSRTGTPHAKSTLTDDLLKIPTKRQKASDFF